MRSLPPTGAVPAGAVLAALAALAVLGCAACGSTQTAAPAPSSSAARSSSAAPSSGPPTASASLLPSPGTPAAPAPDSGGALPLPPLKASPDYAPSWMKQVLKNQGDPVASGQATLAMASIASNLNADGYSGLTRIPMFPTRVVRQCIVLNADLPDPNGEAARTFTVPQHPLTPTDGSRINASLRKGGHCY